MKIIKFSLRSFIAIFSMITILFSTSQIAYLEFDPGQVSLADLIAISISYDASPKVGQELEFHSVIFNLGGTDANGSTTMLRIENATTTVKKLFQYHVLIPRATTQYQRGWGRDVAKFLWIPTQSGTYTLSVCADIYNVIPESDETNNCIVVRNYVVQ